MANKTIRYPTVEDAVIAAIEDIDALSLDPVEMITGFDLGEFAASVGGGYYWNLRTQITRGLAAERNSYSDQSIATNRREFKSKLLDRMESIARDGDRG
jgi:hypothetical protein